MARKHLIFFFFLIKLPRFTIAKDRTYSRACEKGLINFEGLISSTIWILVVSNKKKWEIFFTFTTPETFNKGKSIWSFCFLLSLIILWKLFKFFLFFLFYIKHKDPFGLINLSHMSWKMRVNVLFVPLSHISYIYFVKSYILFSFVLVWFFFAVERYDFELMLSCKKHIIR